MNERILVLVAGAAATAWAFSRWRRALVAAMVMVVAEGAIRKWLVPGAQDLVYFAKDVLLMGVYAGFLADRRAIRIRVPPPLVAGTIAGLFFGALQVFNPSLPNLLVGLLGFKAYFFYVPLLWVVPAAFDDDRQLARFLSRYVWLAIPVGLLAVAQFFSPGDSALNTYARGTASYATTFGTSTRVRVTGTFSYITGYSSYLLTISILILAILATTRWRLRDNWRHYAALAVTLLGMLMTGSRGPVFSLALLFPLYFWLSIAREGGSAPMAGRLVLGIAVLVALLNVVGADALTAFYGRAQGTADLQERLFTPLFQPFSILPQVGIVGFGIGSAHPMAEAVTPGLLPYSWLRGILAEDEPSRVMLELGLIGFVAVYVVRIYLIFLALGQVFQLKTPFHRSLAASCVLFYLAHLLGGVVFNVTAGVYFWFLTGLLFLVMRLDAEIPAPASAAR